MLGDLEFRNVWLLFAALGAVPLFLLARHGGGQVVFSSLRMLPSQRGSWRARLAWIPDALVALAAVSLCVALAGPRVPQKERIVHREGIAIMMVVDVSSSMMALDLSDGARERTRLDAVKEVFHDFVAGGHGLPGRESDAIGLVSFAGYADTRSPLTLDHTLLLDIASDLKIVTQRTEDGTAIGDGLSLAVERLKDAKAKSRVAVLLTDGVNNKGIDTPDGAAELARTEGIKVYTVGAGTNGMARVRVPDPFSGRPVLRSMPVEIDEDTLKNIAGKTGGTYFRATDADGLRDVYKQIDTLERTKLEEQRRLVDFDEYYGYVLALGLLLACLGWIGRGTVFRRLP